MAGMLLSFHLAGQRALENMDALHPEAPEQLATWTEIWSRTASSLLLQGWLKNVEGAGFVPKDDKALETLLACFLVERCVLDAERALSQEPERVHLPLRCLLGILGEGYS